MKIKTKEIHIIGGHQITLEGLKYLVLAGVATIEELEVHKLLTSIEFFMQPCE